MSILKGVKPLLLKSLEPLQALPTHWMMSSDALKWLFKSCQAYSTEFDVGMVKA